MVLDTPYAGETVLQVVLVTGLLGAGAAWLSGRAIAATWRPIWHAAVAMVLIGAAARFIHYALFHGTLLSPTSFACDMAVFLAVGLIAWRATHAAQMVRQYPWLYVRAGPLNWREFEQAK